MSISLFLLMELWINISIWATAHLPLPNPTLTLTCCQLTVVELGEGRWAVAQILILIRNCSVLQV